MQRFGSGSKGVGNSQAPGKEIDEKAKSRDWTSLELQKNLRPHYAPYPPQTPNLGIEDRAVGREGVEAPKQKLPPLTCLKTKPNLEGKDCPLGSRPLHWHPLPYFALFFPALTSFFEPPGAGPGS